MRLREKNRMIKNQIKIIIHLICACLLVGITTIASAETVLITGSNSGIGLEFAKQYAAKGWQVIATHRRDTTPESLQKLAAKYRNVRVEQMDVSNRDQINQLATKLQGTAIDVLINNAGLVMLGALDFQNNSQSFGTLNYDHFDTMMATNVKGPMLVTEAFIGHLRAGKLKKIIAISSMSAMVSVPPANGGMYWYGMSKAALNKLMVTLAADLKKEGVTVVMFHPGFVKVEKMAGFDFPGMIETTVAVGNMIKTIDGLTISDTGKFMQNDGAPQPW